MTLFVCCISFEGRLDQPEALVMEIFGSEVKVCGQLLRQVFFLGGGGCEWQWSVSHFFPLTERENERERFLIFVQHLL